MSLLPKLQARKYSTQKGAETEEKWTYFLTIPPEIVEQAGWEKQDNINIKFDPEKKIVILEKGY